MDPLEEPLDETTDGPDVARAKARVAKMMVQTSDVDVVAESRRLSRSLMGVGRRNHFAERFREIIRGTA